MDFQEDKTEVKWMKLGDVCKFQYGKHLSKKHLIFGIYPVVGDGKSPLGYHNVYNVPENSILISRFGTYAGYVSIYSDKVFVTNHSIFINKYETCVIKKYIYYYLKLSLQHSLYRLKKGSVLQCINKKDIENIKIPIPSLEKQQEIVSFCESNDRKIKELEEEIECNKKLSSQILSSIFKSSETINEDISDEEKDNSENFNEG